MINKKVQDAINDQIKHELYSAYYYLSMSAYCGGKNLPGFANWMHLQYQEETQHALRLFRFLLDRGGKVELQAIRFDAGKFTVAEAKAWLKEHGYKPC